MRHNIGVIILAGGSGRRAGGYKQFKSIAGKPLLFYCMEAFLKSGCIREMIIVLPKRKIRFASNMIARRFKMDDIHIVAGGATRRSSTYEGLRLLDGLRKKGIAIDYVIVHDAVRPFITPQNIRAIAKEMVKWGGAVTGTPSNGIPLSIKKGFVVDVFNKKRYGMYDGATPQCFRFEELWNAYKKVKGMKGIDDAADNLEILKAARSRLNIKMVPLYPNLKVTYKEDIRIVSALLG